MGEAEELQSLNRGTRCKQVKLSDKPANHFNAEHAESAEN
jgi:hypothetical protein